MPDMKHTPCGVTRDQRTDGSSKHAKMESKQNGKKNNNNDDTYTIPDASPSGRSRRQLKQAKLLRKCSAHYSHSTNFINAKLIYLSEIIHILLKI
jgi:hypothetical protein